MKNIDLGGKGQQEFMTGKEKSFENSGFDGKQ
mgnify:CR=1 FL=1